MEKVSPLIKQSSTNVNLYLLSFVLINQYPGGGGLLLNKLSISVLSDTFTYNSKTLSQIHFEDFSDPLWFIEVECTS